MSSVTASGSGGVRAYCRRCAASNFRRPSSERAGPRWPRPRGGVSSTACLARALSAVPSCRDPSFHLSFASTYSKSRTLCARVHSHLLRRSQGVHHECAVQYLTSSLRVLALVCPHFRCPGAPRPWPDHELGTQRARILGSDRTRPSWGGQPYIRRVGVCS